VFWLAVTVLVVRGSVTADTPVAEREYLAASAPAGDPYADYYRGLVDGPLTSLEVYTNRMITPDEYLQLRGILAMVPGARLYVYKQPFDEGYSLELQYGNQEPAFVRYLMSESVDNYAAMIGVERSPEKGFMPVSMESYDNGLDLNWDGLADEPEDYTVEVRLGPATTARDVREELEEHGLFVYINREKIELLPKFDVNVFGLNDGEVTVRVNNVELEKVQTQNWTDVVVEGRTRKSPTDRMAKLLGAKIKAGFSRVSNRQTSGTYRAWYEDIDWPENEPKIARYNDRRVSLDFLLDTEFGENAMIQTAVTYDSPKGRYAVQVIDDTDLSLFEPRINVAPAKLSKTNPWEIKNIDIFFKRLPTQWEVQSMQHYLAGSPGYDLRVFQDCGEAAGNYNFYLGNGSGLNGVTSVLSVGEVHEEPLRFSFRRSSDGEPDIGVHETDGTWNRPSIMHSYDVFMRIDGRWISFPATGGHYHRSVLDPAPDVYALGCLGTTPVGEGEDLWTMTFPVNNDKFFQATIEILEEMGFKDRDLEFYINKRSVDAGAFSKHPYSPGARVEMSTREETPGATVVVRLVE